MTRKDFELIANTIKAERTLISKVMLTEEVEEVDKALAHLVDRFVIELSGVNPRFDPKRFRKACEPDS